MFEIMRNFRILIDKCENLHYNSRISCEFSQ
nr:MAG TPA_asm: hypothetical protein [Bacteriophage sp.]